MPLTNQPWIRHYLKISIAVPALAIALLFAGPGAAAHACPNSGTAPANLSSAEAEASVACLVNKARRSHHVRRLSWAPGLQAAAQGHSAAMDSGNFFGHGDVLGRIRATGYLGGASAWMVGENIHWGVGGQGSPKATVARWMRSATHRSTMLSRRFRNIGVGVAMGAPVGGLGGNSAIYTADFGLSR
jgi:uncharacterized protein YkwD